MAHIFGQAKYPNTLLKIAIYHILQFHYNILFGNTGNTTFYIKFMFNLYVY